MKGVFSFFLLISFLLLQKHPHAQQLKYPTQVKYGANQVEIASVDSSGVYVGVWEDHNKIILEKYNHNLERVQTSDSTLSISPSSYDVAFSLETNKNIYATYTDYSRSTFLRTVYLQQIDKDALRPIQKVKVFGPTTEDIYHEKWMLDKRNSNIYYVGQLDTNQKENHHMHLFAATISLDLSEVVHNRIEIPLEEKHRFQSVQLLPNGNIHVILRRKKTKVFKPSEIDYTHVILNDKAEVLYQFTSGNNEYKRKELLTSDEDSTMYEVALILPIQIGKEVHSKYSAIQFRKINPYSGQVIAEKRFDFSEISDNESVENSHEHITLTNSHNENYRLYKNSNIQYFTYIDGELYVLIDTWPTSSEDMSLSRIFLKLSPMGDILSSHSFSSCFVYSFYGIDITNYRAVQTKINQSGIDFYIYRSSTSSIASNFGGFGTNRPESVVSKYRYNEDTDDFVIDDLCQLAPNRNNNSPKNIKVFENHVYAIGYKMWPFSKHSILNSYLMKLK